MALFGKGRGTYNIEILKENRWVTQAVRHWEGEAKEQAEKILENKKIAGVRVVLEDPGGFEDGDEVIFEKRQEVTQKKKIKITTIETPPPVCTSVREFFSLESRILMNVILREYLESVFLTPTEILHSHKDLKRLMDYEGVLSSAIDNISRLQIRATGQSNLERRQEIYDIYQQITERSERASGMDLPKLSRSFSSLVQRMKPFKSEAPEYLAMLVLSRTLAGRRNWVGKLDLLLDLAANEEMGAPGLLLLDTVIADVLGANVLQEILGWQPSLGSAIIAMIDLGEGKLDVEDENLSEVTLKLSEQLSSGRLPASRKVLIDRAIRQIKSPHPLYKAEPDKEMEEYQKILLRLLVPGGILSGSDAAEAITVRGARFVEQGGASGRRTAINATVKAMPDKARGVMYLAELSNTEIGDEHINDIVTQIDGVFSARVIEELCRQSMSPKERMVTATGAFMAAQGSALPGDLKERVTDHIDGVLEKYLVDENIVDKLDNPQAHLRDRAVRLVKFCGAGVLPEGKALTRARKRIVELLRQPNFERGFIEGLADATIAERALRDFHELLKKAGLS